MSDLESKRFQNSARKLVLKAKRQDLVESSLILILISSAHILVYSWKVLFIYLRSMVNTQWRTDGDARTKVNKTWTFFLILKKVRDLSVIQNWISYFIYMNRNSLTIELWSCFCLFGNKGKCKIWSTIIWLIPVKDNNRTNTFLLLLPRLLPENSLSKSLTISYFFCQSSWHTSNGILTMG